MKKREFKISFFLHVWEKKAEEISLEEFHNAVPFRCRAFTTVK